MYDTGWPHDESPIPVPPEAVVYQGGYYTVVDRNGPYWIIEQDYDEWHERLAVLPEELFVPPVQDQRPVQACYSPGLLDKVGQIMEELYIPQMRAMLEQENVLLRYLNRA